MALKKKLLETFPYKRNLLEKRLEKIEDYTRKSDSFFSEDDDKQFLDDLINSAPLHLTTHVWLKQSLLTGISQNTPGDSISKIFWSETGMGQTNRSRKGVFSNTLKTLGIYLPSPSSKTFIDYDYKIARDHGIARSSFFVPSILLSLSFSSERYFPEFLGSLLWFVSFQGSFLPDRKLIEKYGLESNFKRFSIFFEKNNKEYKRCVLSLIKHYLEDSLLSGGKEKQNENWERIWKGFSLLFTVASMNTERKEHRQRINNLTSREKFIEIIKEKAYLSSFAHGTLSIRGKKINDWFQDPEKFVEALEKCSHLVNPGSPETSMFLTDLVSFEGPMFKIFSDKELEIISDWIKEIPREKNLEKGENLPNIPVKVKIEQISPDVKQFTLTAKDNEQLPAFTPGSHISIMFGQENNRIVRQYSLINFSEESNKYVILVRHTKESKGGSEYLHKNLREDENILISKPINNFPLGEKGRKHLLLAGGIGITPFISYLPALEKAGVDFELHYGVRDLKHGPLVDELKQRLKEKLYLYDLSKNEVMDIQTLVGNQLTGTHLYVCGPEKMISSTIDIAQNLGWNSSYLHFERFAQSCEGEEFIVHLLKSKKEIFVPKNQNILETLENSGIQVPYSCRNGQCGTCITEIIKGDIDHKDQCLSEEQRQKQMAICVSRSLGGSPVTLNL